jgi:hypothetical protein
MIGGNKADLIKRILNWEEKIGEPGKLFRELGDFRRPKQNLPHRPPINQHYAETFNHVDKFNRLLGEMTYRPPCRDIFSRLVTGLISVAIVNSWALVQDHRARTDDEEKISLKASARELYLELKGST